MMLQCRSSFRPAAAVRSAGLVPRNCARLPPKRLISLRPLRPSSLNPGSLTRAPQARSICCAAFSSSTAPTTSDNRFKRSIWTAIDVAALLGAVGGALAALLGVVSPTYALVLPLVLPVVSLIAALQREDLTKEEDRQYLDQLNSSIGRDALLLRAAAEAIEEVRRDVRTQSGSAGRLAALEDKLSVLEGAVVGAARNSREAALGVSALSQSLAQQGPVSLQGGPGGGPPANLAQDPQAMAHLAGLVASEVLPLVKAELATSIGPWLADSSASLRRLDTRLAVVEGSLSGLETAQSEGLRRLSGSIHSSLMDAESALQSSVRVEVATAVEPLKQLPQLVAAAAARVASAAVQQQQQLLLEAGGEAGEGHSQQTAAAAAAAVGGGGVLDQTLLVQEVREVVAGEVTTAMQQLLNQQAELQQTLAQPPRPAPLSEEQWEALGRRLSRLERLLQTLPDLNEQSITQQLAQLLPATQQALSEVQEAALAKMTDTVTAQVASQLGQGQGPSGAGEGGSSNDGVLLQGIQGLVGRVEGLEQSVQDVGQLLAAVGSSAAAAAADGSNGAAVQQLLHQLQGEVQQLITQQQQQGPPLQVQQQQQEQALSGLQQQVQQLQYQLQDVAASLAQLQQQLVPQQLVPQQLVGPDSSSTGGSSSSGRVSPDLWDGAVYDDGDSSSSGGGVTSVTSPAAAAASAAAAAAQGVQELKSLVGGLQAASAELYTQVGSLTQQVAAQQYSAAAGVDQQQWEQQQQQADAVVQLAQQQLQQAGAELVADVTRQLTDLGQDLQQQVQQMQQDMAAAVDAAAAAAARQAMQDYQQQPLEQYADCGAAAAVGALPGAQAYSPYPQLPAGPEAWQQQQQESAAPPSGPSPQEGFPPQNAAAAWQQQQRELMQLPQQPVPPLPQAQQPPQQPLQQQQRGAGPVVSLPDVTTLSEEHLRLEGLRTLRTGREATRGTGAYAASGPDFAAAEGLLQAAVACFGAAVEATPEDTRALGNFGNALLAQGELKNALLEELRLSVGQEGLGREARLRLEGAEGRLRSEAAALLTRAGEIFRRVLEVDGWSSRALVNWGKALVGRAELAADRGAASKLYNAAIDKFEAVLEEDPEMLVAKYRCALAMQGLATLEPQSTDAAGDGSSGSSPRQRSVLLGDAVAYLSDIVAAKAGGDEVLLEAAKVALRQAQEQLEMAKLQR